MGKVVERISSQLVPESCDRHANKIDIYRCKSKLFHVNFRNLQIKLTRKEFEVWKIGFSKANKKLGELMNHDQLEPYEKEKQ